MLFRSHTYVVGTDSCKQDWFSFSCILEEFLVCGKESHQSICRAILMLDATTVVHFCQPSIPLAEGQSSKYSAMISLTLSRVSTSVTERSPLAAPSTLCCSKSQRGKCKRHKERLGVLTRNCRNERCGMQD